MSQELHQTFIKHTPLPEDAQLYFDRPDQFRELIMTYNCAIREVRTKLETTFLEFYETYQAEDIQEQYEKTVSDDNVNNCIVYIDVSGNLAVVADIYALAGAESYRHLLAIDGDVAAAYPKAEPFE